MYLNKSTIKKLAKDYDDYTIKRQQLIDHSRTVLTLSKQLIYSIHRNDGKEIDQKFVQLKKDVNKLRIFIKKTKELENEGMYSAAMQEYCEAVCFYDFTKNKKIPTISDLKISANDYLLGLCDLTGELSRAAVHNAIKHNSKKITEIYQVINEIYGVMLEFNLRNSELRKKSDAIKWNLKKVEDLIYEESKKNKS